MEVWPFWWQNTFHREHTRFSTNNEIWRAEQLLWPWQRFMGCVWVRGHAADESCQTNCDHSQGPGIRRLVSQYSPLIEAICVSPNWSKCNCCALNTQLTVADALSTVDCLSYMNSRMSTRWGMESLGETKFLVNGMKCNESNLKSIELSTSYCQISRLNWISNSIRWGSGKTRFPGLFMTHESFKACALEISKNVAVCDTYTLKTNDHFQEVDQLLILSVWYIHLSEWTL